MGLESWYYDPPLPPHHEVLVPLGRVEEVSLGVDSVEGLTHGVEVYIGPWFCDPVKLRRGMFAAGEAGGLVSRRPRGGTDHRSRTWGVHIVPAELVDAGLLGPENVPDFDRPIACNACDAEIPGRSPTGLCADGAACGRRRDAVAQARRRAAFERLVALEVSDGGPYRMAGAEHDALHWAAEELVRLRWILGED